MRRRLGGGRGVDTWGRGCVHGGGVVWLIGVGGGVILCVWLCCVRRGVLNSDGNLVSRWIVCVGVVGHRVVRMF